MSLRLLHEAEQETALSAPYWQPWQQWFAPVPELALMPAGQVAAYLNQRKPSSLNKQFVPQDDLPEGMAYESFIAEQGRIPTRDGLHDFFNGLCWFAFPQTKAHFNRLHQEQITQLGTHARGRVRDMLTVIDENGFLIQAPDALWQALQAKQWQQAFVDLAPLWTQSKVMVFGHALLEKLVNPYKAITAHALRIPSHLKLGEISSTHLQPPTESAQTQSPNRGPQIFQLSELQALDHFLADQLSAEYLSTKPYIPVQIFGIPSWSSEQEQPDFYTDTQVFRPARSKPLPL